MADPGAGLRQAAVDLVEPRRFNQPVAIGATLYRFQIELSDIDRGVYESLDLRVARHPSEESERMIVRVLAHALAYEDGLEFGRGLSNVDDAAMWKLRPDGTTELWIDVGAPSADRLHRASKAAARVAVYTNKPETSLRKEWGSRNIHGADKIEVVRLPDAVIKALAENEARSVTWYVTIQDRELSVAEGEASHSGATERLSLADFMR